jgi:hypothetical protein
MSEFDQNDQSVENKQEKREKYIHRDKLMSNVLTVSNILALISVIVIMARWQQSTDDRLKELEKHTISEQFHMPFQEKIEVFVPRVELTGKLESINHSLDDIKDELIEMRKTR